MSDRPRYRQIADALRAKIASGELSPGDEVPSEPELARQYDVARLTARRALEVLRTEGRLQLHVGKRSTVRERTLLRRVSSELTTRGPLRGWNAAMEQAGRRPTVVTTVAWVEASRAIAGHLDVEVGTPVLARLRVMGAEGEPPSQLATSHIPEDIVEQVPALTLVGTGPGGMLARLEDAGFGPLRFQEILGARMPQPTEAKTLQLGPGVPVLLVMRLTFAADGRVVDAQERVIASDRIEQSYTFGPGWD